MSASEKSIGDYCRDYIRQKHQEDSNYWNTVSIEKRNQEFSTYCDGIEKIDYKKHHSVFTQQLSKLNTELGIKPTTQRQSKPTAKKFEVTGSSQRGTIIVEDKKQSTSTEAVTTDDKGVTTRITETKDGKKITHPKGCQCLSCKGDRKEITDILDDEMCGALPEIFIDFWHARNTNVKVLTENEVKRVGRVLKPLFARYVGGDILLFLAPALVVGQILSSRMTQAKQGNKKEKEKPDDRDYSDEPSVGSDTKEIENKTKNEPVARRKYFSSSKIKGIMDEGEKDDEE